MTEATEEAPGRSRATVAGEVELRAAVTGDVPACLDVFYEAGEELHLRTGQPVMPRNPVPLGRLFGHLIETDPERAWIARTAAAEIVGFGLAHRREASWFLAFLFVRSDHQAAGIGRRLLEACVGGEDRSMNLATCIEAIQPVSAGLYASFGMLPRVPLYVMTGRRRDERPLSSVHDLVAVPFADFAASDRDALAAEIDAVDRETLGYAHPQDHRFWVLMDRIGYLFRESGKGTGVGYGYVTPSGRIGPVAVRDERWLPEILDHLFAAIDAPEAWLIFVPGTSVALVPLLRAGLRFDGAPALFCSSDVGPAFERYLAGNFAVL